MGESWVDKKFVCRVRLGDNGWWNSWEGLLRHCNKFSRNLGGMGEECQGRG